ncbi:MAG: type II toxin-antitoxin system RelE/ParE family toxin [Saprospiraceae bacterium]|nr:type II toxin-antitoxin system RelE/ParE family toxin [Saprospiraceae bacterium]HRD80314.1 type II toxin-antitoxin system RelE/ParE family toxin [Saprospiraceae bacterium]
MAKQVVWTKTALSQLEKMFSYIEAEYSLSAAKNLIIKVFNKVETLRHYPEAGRPSRSKKTVRGINVDKYRKLYYRLHGRRLIIVYLFDSRRNPDYNPY